MAKTADQDRIIAAKLQEGRKLTSSELARLQMCHRGQPRQAGWLPCTLPHTHDIVRWSEPVQAAKDGGVTIPGRRLVTAEVLKCESDSLLLSILSQEWLAEAPGAAALQTGDSVRRKIALLLAGYCERLTT